MACDDHGRRSPGMAVKAHHGMMERLSALVLVGGLSCGAMITGGATGVGGHH